MQAMILTGADLNILIEGMFPECPSQRQ
jgi:hypothetical protein